MPRLPRLNFAVAGALVPLALGLLAPGAPAATAHSADAVDTVDVTTARARATATATATGPASAAAATAPARATATTDVPYPRPARLAGTEYPTYFGGYRTTAAYQQFPHDLAAAYPETVQVRDIGDSWLKTQGRGGADILAVRITADVADQPEPTDGQGGRPRFLLSAQMHAREIITSEVAWRYATELVDGYGVDPQTTALLDSTEVWITMQDNPDGAAMVETAMSDPAFPTDPDGIAQLPPESPALQRKNVDDVGFVQVPPGADPDLVRGRLPGVDLNRNFATDWGGPFASDDSGSEDYAGASAGSEPETQAKITLMTQLFGEHPVSDGSPAPSDRTGTMLSVHSCVGVVGYPRSYTTDPAPNLDAMRASAFRQTAASGYAAGAVADVIGQSSGTQTDWVYAALGVPAFTLEVGGCQPTPFFQPYAAAGAVYDAVAPGIRFAAEAAYAPYSAPLGGLVESVRAEREPDGSVRVSGTATDERYGAATPDKADPPPVTPIIEVEAALATDRAHIDTTTPLDVAAAAPTTEFSGTISADEADDGANAVFVRAKNASGQWGPWRAPAADAVLPPVYAGTKTIDLRPLSAQDFTLDVRSQVATSFEVSEGALPSGLSLDAATGRVTGTTGKPGTSNAVVRVTTAQGPPTTVDLRFDVRDQTASAPAPARDGSASTTAVLGAFGLATLSAVAAFVLSLRRRRPAASAA